MVERYPDNAILWARGHTVIHRGDAKEPRMLLKIVGFTRVEKYPKCQYVDRRNGRKIYAFLNKDLLNPEDFKLNFDWGDSSQEYLQMVQAEWDRVRRWNRLYRPGIKVKTTSADGGFETYTKSEAIFNHGGEAIINLEKGGNWLLKFVESAVESAVEPAGRSD